MRLWPFPQKKRGGAAIVPYWLEASKSDGTFNDRLQQLEGKFDAIKPTDPEQLTHQSRSDIAKFFVHAFVWLIVLVIVFPPLYNWLALKRAEPIDIDKILSTVGGLLGTPLGFIVGYYFEKSKK